MAGTKLTDKPGITLSADLATTARKPLDNKTIVANMANLLNPSSYQFYDTGVLQDIYTFYTGMLVTVVTGESGKPETYQYIGGQGRNDNNQIKNPSNWLRVATMESVEDVLKSDYTLYRGKFNSFELLEEEIFDPSPQDGHYAIVDEGTDAHAKFYLWDSTDNTWILSTGTTSLIRIDYNTPKKTIESSGTYVIDYSLGDFPVKVLGIHEHIHFIVPTPPASSTTKISLRDKTDNFDLDIEDDSTGIFVDAGGVAFSILGTDTGYLFEEGLVVSEAIEGESSVLEVDSSATAVFVPSTFKGAYKATIHPNHAKIVFTHAVGSASYREYTIVVVNISGATPHTKALTINTSHPNSDTVLNTTVRQGSVIKVVEINGFVTAYRCE